MQIQIRQILAVVLTLVMVLSIAGAQPNFMQTHVLAETVEAEAVGGMSCAAVWGFGLAVGVAALSGCGIVCGTIAWYTLLALNECE
jgi:hypothetical protein